MTTAPTGSAGSHGGSGAPDFFRAARARTPAGRCRDQLGERPRIPEFLGTTCATPQLCRPFADLSEIQAQFPKISVLNARRVVFNIGGNKYRMVVKVKYTSKKVFVRFIGTHAEYDRINANEV